MPFPGSVALQANVMTRRIFNKTKEDSVTGLAIKKKQNKQQVKGKSETQWN